MAFKALPSTNFPFTMGCWGIAAMSNQLTIAEPDTQTPGKSASLDRALERAVREYVRTYVLWRGRRRASEDFGVSRHTLWRFLERGHMGRALPRAVMGIAGDSIEALEAATWAIPAVERLVARRPAPKTVPPSRSLPEALEDTLLLLCAAPLSTVDELSRFGRVPASTLRDRLRRLARMGMADSVSHSLTIMGPHPHLRHFPTEKGIEAGAMVEHGTETFLSEYPVSRQWFRLLAERLDAVAMLYRAAALVAAADSRGEPVRVDHYRQGPYDMLITLSGGRSVGLLRQGATLPSANLRYRLRTLENLSHGQRPMATLALAFSDQANRRAVRTLGDPQHHHRTFVATEGELLAGDHRGVVWQQCGGGTELHLPVKVDPGVSLENIIARTDRLAERLDDLRRRHSPNTEREPSPDPDTLYPVRLRAAMPEPSDLLRSSLAVRLTGAEKDALDLLAAWPPVHHRSAGRADGRRHPPPGQPGPQLSHRPLPVVHRGSAPRALRRGAELPGPTGQGRRRAGPGPLERAEATTSQRQSPRLHRHGPAGHRIPDGAPRRHHRLRCNAQRRSSPFP